jgi:hypothetical protein
MRFVRLLVIGAIAVAATAPATAAIPKACSRGPALNGSCTFKHVGGQLRIEVGSVGMAALFAPRTITCLNPYHCVEANVPEGVGLTRVDVRMTAPGGDTIFTCTSTTVRGCSKKDVSALQYGAQLTCTMYVQRARSFHPRGSAVQLVPSSGTFACSSGG